MSAKRLAEQIEFKEQYFKEADRFLSVQVKLWRSFSIIASHHPDITKSFMFNMALNGTLVGDIKKLEVFEKKVTKFAQSCGVTSGVFAPDPNVPVCTLTRERFWGIEE
jgi:hypothetical protein